MVERFVQTLKMVVFAMAFVGCGGETGLTSSHVKDTVTDRPSTVHVLYWDNKNLGFGHVAVLISGAPSVMTGDLYISYAMGNDYSVDREKHGKDPVRILLPTPSSEHLATFQEWYQESPYANPYSDTYGQDYSLLRHNCAHAALNVLRRLGYELPIKSDAPLALRPKQVHEAALAIRGSQILLD